MRAEAVEVPAGGGAQPRSSEAHFNLGWALLGEDEIDEAESLLGIGPARPVERGSIYALALLHLKVATAPGP